MKVWQFKGIQGKGVANMQLVSKLHIADMCHGKTLLGLVASRKKLRTAFHTEAALGHLGK